MHFSMINPLLCTLGWLKAITIPREELWWLPALAEVTGCVLQQPWAAAGAGCWLQLPAALAGAGCCGHGINGALLHFPCAGQNFLFSWISLCLLICNWMELIKCLGKVHWNFLMRSCVYWPCHSQQREFLMTGFTFVIHLHVCLWRLVSNLWKNLPLTILDPELSF